MFADIKPTDPLEFFDTESYKNRLAAAQKKTGLDDAVVTGLATIEGHKVATAVMDFDFMGGSMGSVVGEKVTRIMEKAIEQRLPVLCITSSGGARMRESALCLIQIANSSSASAEYLMKYGQVDVVSSRKDLRATLSNILAMHE